MCLALMFAMEGRETAPRAPGLRGAGLWLLPSLLRTPGEDVSLQNKRLLGLAALTGKQMELAAAAWQPDFLRDNFIKTQRSFDSYP